MTERAVELPDTAQVAVRVYSMLYEAYQQQTRELQALRAAARVSQEAWSMVYLMTAGSGKPDSVVAEINSLAKREAKNLSALLPAARG